VPGPRCPEGSLTRPICVVTVVHNAAASLPGMLSSLPAASTSGAVPLVAVDNGSADAGVAILRAAGVRVLEQSNTGFGHGLNRGIELAPPDHDVLISNPDVRFAPGMIDRLGTLLDEQPGTGIAVPALLGDDGQLAPSLRRDPTWWRTAVEALVGGSRAGRLGEAFVPGPHRQVVDWATGAVLLLRREALERSGAFDESFFLYSEETELCQRWRRDGWQVVCEPAAQAFHAGGAMASVPALWALRAVNRVRLHRRTAGRVSTGVFRAASLAFEGRRALLGDAPARAAVRSLRRRDLDGEAIRLTLALGGDPTPMAPAAGTPG
jgi:N-acetylglucosaminyl-diphospho-decaprenol L-rhamnosyltransferase